MEYSEMSIEFQKMPSNTESYKNLLKSRNPCIPTLVLYTLGYVTKKF